MAHQVQKRNPTNPIQGEGCLDSCNKPKARSDLVRCFGDPPSADGPHQREDVRDGPTVALAVLAQPDQELLVAHQITHQGRDDDCRDLADSQAAAVDDLACGLEAKQRDGCELSEVDLVGIASRRVRAVYGTALDYRRRHNDADGLEEERGEQSTSEAVSADDPV